MPYLFNPSLSSGIKLLNFKPEIQNSRIQILNINETFGTIMWNPLCGYKCFLRTPYLMSKIVALPSIVYNWKKRYVHMWNCWPYIITQNLNCLGHCIKQDSLLPMGLRCVGGVGCVCYSVCVHFSCTSSFSWLPLTVIWEQILTILKILNISGNGFLCCFSIAMGFWQWKYN